MGKGSVTIPLEDYLEMKQQISDAMKEQERTSLDLQLVHNKSVQKLWEEAGKIRADERRREIYNAVNTGRF